MNALWNSALGLLAITGALLGLSLPFGKIATEAGVPQVVWAFVISAGGGGAILVAMLLQGQLVTLTARKLRYFFITAAITYALGAAAIAIGVIVTTKAQSVRAELLVLVYPRGYIRIH